MSKKSINSGVTLLELMIVVAIIGILASIAYPSYRDYTDKTYRVDAMGALSSFANAMERFYAVNNTYIGVGSGTAGTATAVSFAPHSSVFVSQSPIDNTDKKYNLWVTAVAATTYTLAATPISLCASAKPDTCKKGMITLDSTGTRTWDENKDGDATDAGETDWDQG